VWTRTRPSLLRSDGAALFHEGSLHFDAGDLAVFPDEGSRAGEEIEVDLHRLVLAEAFGDGGEAAQEGDRLAQARLEQDILVLGGQVRTGHTGAGACQVAELTQLLGSHRNLVGATAAKDDHVIEA
jgi:hypothetical protein